MYRAAMEDLKNWKDRPNKKPMIIRGARQVGKTWLMKEFGKTFFQEFVYINFDNNNPAYFSVVKKIRVTLFVPDVVKQNSSINESPHCL